MSLRISGKTYGELGNLFGVSRQRIHQLLTGYKPTSYRRSKKKYNKRWSKTGAGKECHRRSQQQLRGRVKLLVLKYYGNGKLACVKCGFTDDRALTIDHINGGGSRHIKGLKLQRGGSSFYHWLIKNNYPVGYQTLCMNCQLIKRFENKEW